MNILLYCELRKPLFTLRKPLCTLWLKTSVHSVVKKLTAKNAKLFRQEHREENEHFIVLRTPQTFVHFVLSV